MLLVYEMMGILSPAVTTGGGGSTGGGSAGATLTLSTPKERIIVLS